MRLFLSLAAAAAIVAHASTSRATEARATGTATTNAIGTVTLRWTSPGNDSLTGKAAFYDLRISELPITPLNFGASWVVAGVPLPAMAGTTQSVLVKGLIANKLYYFAIKTADYAQNWSVISNVVSKVATSTVGIGPEGARITDLSGPWPNPARRDVSFAASLASPGDVEVEVFDVMGRHVRTLAKGPWPAGDAALKWDLRDDRGARAPTGMYRVRARLGATEFVRAVVVVQ